MGTRPVNWQPFADRDPVPGEAIDTRDLARRYSRTAEAISTAAARLRELINDEGWESKSGDEFRSMAGDTASKIEGAHARYKRAGNALATFADKLVIAQQMADEALSRAKQAATDRDTAQQRADAATEESERNTMQGDADEAQGRIDAECRIVEEAVGIYNEAASKAIDDIDDIIDHDDVKDGFWDRVANVLSSIAEIAGAIAAVAGVLSLLVGWIPVIGQALAAVLGAIALIATLVSLVCNLALLIGGKGSWTALAWDVFALATFGIGRAFSGAAKMSRLGGRAAARTAARGLATSARPGASSTTIYRAVNTMAGGPAGQASRAALRNAPTGIWPGLRNVAQGGYGNLLPELRSGANTIYNGVRAGRGTWSQGFSELFSGGRLAVTSRLLGQADLADESARASTFADDVARNTRVRELATRGAAQFGIATFAVGSGGLKDGSQIVGMFGDDQQVSVPDVTPPSQDLPPRIESGPPR
jgi:hypothetical protein